MLHGELSIYLYGQPSMGSLEVYLSAPVTPLYGCCERFPRWF
jgi:hypothetical protein